MISNKDMPAMPVCSGSETSEYNGTSYTKNFLDSNGLTKREEIARSNMQGILSNPEYACHGLSKAAKVAVEAADALLAELEKTK